MPRRKLNQTNDDTVYEVEYVDNQDSQLASPLDVRGGGVASGITGMVTGAATRWAKNPRNQQMVKRAAKEAAVYVYDQGKERLSRTMKQMQANNNQANSNQNNNSTNSTNTTAGAPVMVGNNNKRNNKGSKKFKPSTNPSGGGGSYNPRSGSSKNGPSNNSGSSCHGRKQ